MSSTERYRLVRTVANGGMAQVVEGMACGLGGFERRVAIKRLLPEHAGSEERRRMFFEEARIGSRLHHGGVISIFDYGLIDGSEFLAMDFVDGLDALRAVTGAAAEPTPMPEGIALHVVAEVAHALAYVHDLRHDDGRPLGIVHRDVSPSNILLSWDGDVKLCDFGIAFSGLRPRDEPTMGGAIKGKLHYMAPEQARGERVTTAADVYALGATLDALLGGGALAPVRSDTSGDARAAAAADRGVSSETSELIRACLCCDPAARPTAAGLAARAGTLAAKRLEGDGRSALVGWLRPLRGLALRRSKLDDLMGLCLVPVGPPEARTLTVTTLRQETPGDEAARAVRRSVRRLPRLLASSALVVTSIAAGLGAGRIIHHFRGKGAIAAPLRWADPDPRPPASEPDPRPAGLSPPSTETTKPSEPTLAAATPIAAPEAAAGAVDQDAPDTAPESEPESEPIPPIAARARESFHAHRIPAGRASAEAPPVGRGDQAATGWLRVGGAKLAGARVTIDRASAGFAPLELELATGVYSVIVTEPATGRVLAHATARITPENTRVMPARLLR